MILVGITGSIGCGKTTLAKIVKKLGYAVFDIDSWVRRIYYNKDFLLKLNKCFPGSVVNETSLLRQTYGGVQFSQRERLD